MFAVASIVSGVRLAGLDGVILFVTAAVVGSALVLGNFGRTAPLETSPRVPRTARPRVVRDWPWPTVVVAAAAFLLIATGELRLRTDGSTRWKLLLALLGLAGACLLALPPRWLALGESFRRTARLVDGVLLIVAAQLMATTQRPVLAHLRFAERAGAYFKLDFNSVDNVLIGLTLFVLGAGVIATGRAPNEQIVAAPAVEAAPTSTRARSRAMGWLGLAAVLLVLPLVDLHRGRYHEWELISWLGALACLAAAARFADRARGISERITVDWRDAAMIACWLAVGGAVGVHDLATVPNSIWGDEGRFWETAAAIARGEFHPSIFEAGVYSFPMLSSYVQAWLMRATEISLWGWRFSSLAPALLAVIPVTLLAKEMFDRRVAFLAGGLLVTSPYFLAFARIGYNNSQALLPVALAMYLMHVGVRRSSALLMTLAGMSAGAGFYVYGGGRVALLIAPVYFAALAVERWRGRSSVVRLAPAMAEFLVGCAAVAAPLMIYGAAVYPVDLRAKTLEAVFPNIQYARVFYSDAQLFRDHGPIVIDQSTLFYRPDLYVALIGRGVVESAMAFVSRAFVHEHYIASPLAGPVGAVLLSIGIGASLRRSARERAGIAVCWLAVGFVALAALNSFPPRQAHLVPVIPAIALLTAAGIVAIADEIAALIRWRARWTSLALALAALVVVGGLGVRNYFVAMPIRYQPGLADVAIFEAQAATKPVTLIWVYDNSEARGYIPWGIEHLPSKATFDGIGPTDLLSGQVTFVAGTAYTVFWTPATNELVTRALDAAVGGTVTPETHLWNGGAIAGFTYSFIAPDRPATASAATNDGGA